MSATRIDLLKNHPATTKAMMALENQLRAGTLPITLKELVKMRVSQINGCAFCIDLHVDAARKQGETDRRLHLLAAWREAGVFDARECAALAWAEALTRLAGTQGVPEAVYDALAAQFSEAEIVELTLAVVAINGWNRFQIGFRAQPANAAAA
ncbi:carboxymuconolactone decarboxylase family protein [Acidovorax sp. SUPP3334]|uniref:carboxymuconolactone decarboxylase family protein n=1 Tax=Acidovorax sp. SUPP3334 TaxID=2920881 RepID=UPI0023DE53CD|nr:carboxymuconolactone decarboxylase family protein [Acidovorax sp. SUPP3334]GKT26216.1 carboxymuconolactone decarboxylase family protein [Acidovorax sp. SUPP3334]